MRKTRRSIIKTGVVIISLTVLIGCGTLFGKRERAGGKGDVGWLRISSNPTGVQVLFAGGYKYDAAGAPLATPCTVQMEPGFYDLWLRLYEYDDWRDTVSIMAGETTKVNIPLRRMFDDEHRKKQAEEAFTMGTVLAALLLVMSLFMRNVDYK